MNKNQLLDMVIYPMFVVVLGCVCILSMLSVVALEIVYSNHPELFSDTFVSFDSLYLVVYCTVPLLLLWLFLILMREGNINLRKKRDTYK